MIDAIAYKRRVGVPSEKYSDRESSELTQETENLAESYANFVFLYRESLNTSWGFKPRKPCVICGSFLVAILCGFP